MERIIRSGRRHARRPTLARAAISLVLSIALFLPCAPPAHALELYYARAIGQEYLPEARPGGLPQGDAAAAPDLPALGDRPSAEPERGEMSVWTKLLIGVALVAAVAALGDGDGGAAQMSVAPGGNPDPGPSGAPAAGGGTGGGGGGAGPSEPLPGAGDNGGNDGGFIDVGNGDFGPDFDDRDDDDNRGRGRGRDRDRDD